MQGTVTPSQSDCFCECYELNLNSWETPIFKTNMTAVAHMVMLELDKDYHLRED